MQWPKLHGKVRQQPPTGTWQDWKQSIANECQGACIYCAIPEGRFGGIRNFHVEHFRPKSRFPKLENCIFNLYLACAICNVLKCDDWPADPLPDHSTLAYPDPHTCDYNLVFTVSNETHLVEAESVAGKYVIERVLLNRAQLILERRLTRSLELMDTLENWLEDSMDKMTHDELRTASKVLLDICRIKTQALTARPYVNSDTKRATSKKARTKKRS